MNAAVAEADSFIHVKRKNSARVITSPVTPVLRMAMPDDAFKTSVRPGGKTTSSRKPSAVVSFTFSFSVVLRVYRLCFIVIDI